MEPRNPLQLWNVPWSHPHHHLTLRGASVVVSGPGDDVALLHIFPIGMTETRLTRTGEPAVPLDISPSGRFILLRERRRTGPMILWDVEHDTQTPLPETIPAHGHMPTGWMTTLAGCEVLLDIFHLTTDI